jgi:HprK-related kinase A
MLRVADVSAAALARALAGPGVALDFGLARARIRSDCPTLAPRMARVYGAFPWEPAAGFFDVTVALRRRRGWRRFVRPQVEFVVDGERPFEPFPADTELPLLEWGLNYCLALRAQHVLLLHAGVVERDGLAIVLPALPGSGKSTLVAGLACRGWRLLSDEFGAVRLADGCCLPVLRPVALKNESIDVVRRAAPHAVLGPTYPRTRKGDVAHLAPDAAAVAQRHAGATPVAVVFPKFRLGVETALEPLPGARAFAKLAANSFNYQVLGPEGFRAMRTLLDQAQPWRLRFGSLDAGIAALDGLHARLVAAIAPQPARMHA